MKKIFTINKNQTLAKNTLIFIPMICGKALTINNVYATILEFIAFNFGVSYIYN